MASDPIDIAVAVVVRGDEVLVGRRPAGSALAGLLEFPGGKVQPGESPPSAAARECLEEAGIEICVGRLLGRVEHAYPHGRLRLHFYYAEPLRNIPPPTPPFGWAQLA